MANLSKVNVRILQSILKDPATGQPCPICSAPLSTDCNLIVFHGAGCADHNHVAVKLAGDNIARTYLAALQSNLNHEVYGLLKAGK